MMKKHKKFRTLVGVGIGFVLLAGLSGCAKIKDTLGHMARSDTGRAMICGGGGAVTGVAVYYGCNALTGKKAECVIGGAAAALADGLSCWWLISQKIINDYDDTWKTLHYDLNQGTIIKILDFDADPKVVAPGGELKIHVKYALMSPSSTDEIQLEQKFTVPGEKQPRIEILTRQPGTWGTDADYVVKIDPKTPQGKVDLVMELKLVDRKSKQDHDQRALCFNVTNAGGAPDKTQLCSGSSVPNTLGTFVVSTKGKKGRPGPGADIVAEPKGKNLAHVQSGDEFPILEQKKQGSSLWYKIQLKDGTAGWLPANKGRVK